MKRAVFMGSFDPVHKGHMDIITRASNLFDNIVVLVSNDVNKKYLIPIKDRVELVKKSISEYDITNVTVDFYNGDIASTYLAKNKIDCVITGVRNYNDYIFSRDTYMVNNRLSSNPREVIILPASPYFQDISSTMVREIYNSGNQNLYDIYMFTPYVVAKYLENMSNVVKENKS